MRTVSSCPSWTARANGDIPPGKQSFKSSNAPVGTQHILQGSRKNSRSGSGIITRMREHTMLVALYFVLQLCRRRADIQHRFQRFGVILVAC